MTLVSVARIQRRVVEEIQVGRTVDVYGLAKFLGPQCPDLSLQEIADVIAQTVVDAGGNAVWDQGRDRSIVLQAGYSRSQI